MGTARGVLPCVMALGASVIGCADPAPEETSEPGTASEAIEQADAGVHCDADDLPEPGLDGLSPERALEAFARQRTEAACTVQLTRRGDPITIEYQIK
jgi:hypothetical protein